MSEAMVLHLPNQETLGHWAAEGDLDQVSAVLSAVEAGAVSEELRERLDVLNMRTGVLHVFTGASRQLDAMVAHKPGLLASEADLSASHVAEAAPKESGAYTEAISQFLGKLKSETNTIFEKPEDGRPIELSHIRRSLGSDELRPALLKQLQRPSNVPADWLKDSASSTVSSVTDVMWQSVAAGRDLASGAGDPGLSDHHAAELVHDWRSSVSENTDLAQVELRDAVTWLEGEQ